MSYTKQNWADGDLITAAKLNHIEEGIGDLEENGAVFLVEADAAFNDFSCSLNKSWREIFAALAAGKSVFARYISEEDSAAMLAPVIDVGIYSDYGVTLFMATGFPCEPSFETFFSETADGRLCHAIAV